MAELLARAGHDGAHVRAYAMQAASDEAILSRARTEERFVVSTDSDFAAILAAQEKERPSFILFRERICLLHATTLIAPACADVAVGGSR